MSQFTVTIVSFPIGHTPDSLGRLHCLQAREIFETENINSITQTIKMYIIYSQQHCAYHNQGLIQFQCQNRSGYQFPFHILHTTINTQCNDSTNNQQYTIPCRSSWVATKPGHWTGPALDWKMEYGLDDGLDSECKN